MDIPGTREGETRTGQVTSTGSAEGPRGRHMRGTKHRQERGQQRMEEDQAKGQIQLMIGKVPEKTHQYLKKRERHPHSPMA